MRAWGEAEHPDDRPRRREPRDRPPAAARNRVEGDGGEPPRRSRIDLNHGFLRQIQRNQRDRKAYHEAWEEAREQTADANKREYGIGINVMKDGKEWKKPQQWRSFEREGGARDRDDRGPDRRDRERRPPRDERRDDSDGDDDLRSRLTHDEVHERTAAALRSAESRREPAKAEKKKPESADDVADLAEWWGETGGDKARSDIQAAKQREEMKMPKDVKKQTQQRSKPSATAAPFEPKAKSRLDGSAPAFVPKESTKEPGPEKAEEVADGGGALDDWSALDEELEKALNEKKSRGGRRR